MLMECFPATKLSSLILRSPETMVLRIGWYEAVYLYGWLVGMCVGWVILRMFPYLQHIEKAEQGVLSSL